MSLSIVFAQTMPLWGAFIVLGVSLIVGAIIGFIIAGFVFKRQLKKNPPINENMIRAMFKQMGRTPSEKQVRQVMKSMEENR